jgi:hypothetical protein
MTRLALFFLGLVILTIPQFARAADFCAVTLTILTPEAKPPKSTHIEVVDQKGKIERAFEAQGDTVQICDFGFGPHAIRVGSHGCVTSISDVEMRFGYSIPLTAFLNGFCGWVDTMSSGNACELYVRVMNEYGSPVPNAQIQVWSPPAKPVTADSWGRYQGVYIGDLEIVATKPGYENGSARATCKKNEHIDLPIVMNTILRQP